MVDFRRTAKEPNTVHDIARSFQTNVAYRLTSITNRNDIIRPVGLSSLSALHLSWAVVL